MLQLVATKRHEIEILAVAKHLRRLGVHRSVPVAAIALHWLHEIEETKNDRNIRMDDSSFLLLTIDCIVLRRHEHTLHVRAQRVDDILENIRCVILQIVAPTK